MKKGNGFIFLNVKNIISITALSLLLSSSFCFAKEKNLSNSWTDEQIAELMKNPEAKSNFINDLIKEIKKTKSFKLLDDEDRKGFLSYLEKEVFPSFNKNEFENALDLDFSELDKQTLLEMFPDVYAGTPKVSVQELVDLSNMKSEDIEKAIKKYLETGTIEKKYKFIITEELISIIREKEAIINRGIKAEQGIAKAEQGIAKAEQGIAKAEQGIAKAEQGIKRIKELDRKFKLIIKGIEKSLNNAGIH